MDTASGFAFASRTSPVDSSLGASALAVNSDAGGLAVLMRWILSTRAENESTVGEIGVQRTATAAAGRLTVRCFTEIL
jgi:hypothetical protein